MVVQWFAVVASGFELNWGGLFNVDSSLFSSNYWLTYYLLSYSVFLWLFYCFSDLYVSHNYFRHFLLLSSQCIKVHVCFKICCLILFYFLYGLQAKQWFISLCHYILNIAIRSAAGPLALENSWPVFLIVIWNAEDKVLEYTIVKQNDYIYYLVY